MERCGERPPEGWKAFLFDQAQPPANPIVSSELPSSYDSDLYLDYLIATAAPDATVASVAENWDRFVTFGNFSEPTPPSPMTALMQLPSPFSVSPTPSPYLPMLPLPAEMQRHVTGSPDVVMPVPYPPPILEMPSSPAPGTSPDAPPATHSPSTVFVEEDNQRLARSSVRQKTRRRVREQKLHRTAEGREIIKLMSHTWYRAPSGFAVTQFPPDSNWWRCNDVANYINWLDRGVRVHRSQVCRVLAVENMEALNQVLEEEGYTAIGVTNAPPSFLMGLMGMGERQRDIPVFLRADYLTRPREQKARTRKRPHPPAV